MTSNYSSGQGIINVLNTTDSDFAINSYLLLGTFGSENAEVVQIASINTNTGDINLVAPTNFAHPESTRVTVLPYSQVRFFWTAAQTFDTNTPLTGYINLQPSDWFTQYSDESQSSGYGWYIFYNPITLTASQPSNPIPYAGFNSNNVEMILNDFFSLLNNKELKLISREDALSWMNEANNVIRNKLNLTNIEFNTSAPQTLTVVPGTIEYPLPNDFDHLVSLVSGSDPSNPGSNLGILKRQVEYINLRNAYTYSGFTPRYYIRGMYIGIIPNQIQNLTLIYLYQSRPTRLSLNSDILVLPNAGEYAIKDWMMYRGYSKAQNPNATVYYKSFNDNMNQMIVSAVKRDASLDTFGIIREANV